jgi:hypothetical protein
MHNITTSVMHLISQGGLSGIGLYWLVLYACCCTLHAARTARGVGAVRTQVGHFSLFPLLFQPAETGWKLSA